MHDGYRRGDDLASQDFWLLDCWLLSASQLLGILKLAHIVLIAFVHLVPLDMLHKDVCSSDTPAHVHLLSAIVHLL